MKLKIEIKTDNAAFGDTAIECGEEVARILRELAERIEADGPPEVGGRYGAYDANGNCVGMCYFGD